MRPTWGWNRSSTAARSSASDPAGRPQAVGPGQSGCPSVVGSPALRGVLVDLLARIARVVPVAEPTLVLAVGRRGVPGWALGADAGRERLDGRIVAGAVE